MGPSIYDVHMEGMGSGSGRRMHLWWERESTWREMGSGSGEGMHMGWEKESAPVQS